MITITAPRGRMNSRLFKLLATNCWFQRPTMALLSSSAATISTPQTPSVEACIIGGGIGGCAAAASLLSSPNSETHVMLLEMGRGLGGRASTRFSRDDSRLAINHGAPHAEIQTKEGLAIMKQLEKIGVSKRICPKDSMLEDTAIKAEYWTGNPNMCSICEGLLDSLPRKPTYLFRTMVRAVEPIISDQTVKGWFLKDKDGNILVKTEWLIVAGSGIAHPRWTAAFGGEPPLLAASRNLCNNSLNNALDSIGSVHSRPVQVAMMAFEVKNENSFWKVIKSSSILETPGDKILDKLIIQMSEDGSLVSVVAHSNAEFAESAKDTYGSKSTAARIGGATSSVEREQEVLNMLMNAVEHNLKKMSDDSSLQCPKPFWGPFLHRWGNAFPEGSSLPLENALVADAKIAFCGDYVGDQQRFGTFEGALISGTSIGEQIKNLLLEDKMIDD